MILAAPASTVPAPNRAAVRSISPSARDPEEGQEKPGDEHGLLEMPLIVARPPAVDPGQAIALHERVLGVPECSDQDHQQHARLRGHRDHAQEDDRAPQEKSSVGREAPRAGIDERQS